MALDLDVKQTKILGNYNFLTALLSGGVAGFVVDVSLFPIDTVKTRLQSEKGFWRSGGFSGIYKGLAPAAAGSVPTAAIFFCTYESCKSYLHDVSGVKDSPYIHMAAASMAETLACIIRVPVEIAKQRRQTLTGKLNKSALDILWTAYKTEGIRRGLYRGFVSTLFREIPFSFIQFPLWEYFKLNWVEVTGLPSSPLSVAICGAVAGGISAGITTPLDVAKTRIMLADQLNARKMGIIDVLSLVYKENGVRGLFAGFVPRIMWITMGGAIFFGFYDLTTRVISTNS